MKGQAARAAESSSDLLRFLARSWRGAQKARGARTMRPRISPLRFFFVKTIIQAGRVGSAVVERFKIGGQRGA